MEYLPIISIAISIIGLAASLIIQYFTQYLKIKEDISKLEVDLEGRLSKLEVKTEVFWKSLEKSLPDLLHSPHTPVMDVLLEKMRDEGLNYQESLELKAMIQEEKISGMPEIKKLGAALIIARLDQIIEEGK